MTGSSRCQSKGVRSAASALEPTLVLEINSAALDLSSDEVLDRFHKTLTAKLLERMRAANKALAKLGTAAVQGSGGGGGIDLELAPP